MILFLDFTGASVRVRVGASPLLFLFLFFSSFCEHRCARHWLSYDEIIIRSCVILMYVKILCCLHNLGRVRSGDVGGRAARRCRRPSPGRSAGVVAGHGSSSPTPPPAPVRPPGRRRPVWPGGNCVRLPPRFGLGVGHSACSCGCGTPSSIGHE